MEGLPKEFCGVMEPVLANINQLQLDEYWYEVKWDGVRLLTVINNGKVEIINRHGRFKTTQFPELISLAAAINCKQAVIDGEGVVIRGSHTDFRAIIKRNNRQSAPSVGLMQQLPVSYMVFDLLAANGQSLLDWEYEDRKSKLDDLLRPHPHLLSVEKLANGIDLWSAVQMLELEGLVAKRKRSIYQAGKKHYNWFKIKNRRQHWCIIGGYTTRERQVNALLLGLRTEEGLQYCGRVGLSGDHARNPKVISNLEGLISDCPFCNCNEVPANGHYIIPELEALIEFAEWTPDVKLRQPVLKEIKLL